MRWAGSRIGLVWVGVSRRGSRGRVSAPPVHDRGTVLVKAMLMLAGGGESCADIEHLRSQGRLFGSVPSDSTVYRTIRALDPAILAGLATAVAATRAEVWARADATTGTGSVVLDIDASLVEIHSENKAGTAPHYRSGFGFHPMFCFADRRSASSLSRSRLGIVSATTHRSLSGG